jgi:hypothetical protein
MRSYHHHKDELACHLAAAKHGDDGAVEAIVALLYEPVRRYLAVHVPFSRRGSAERLTERTLAHLVFSGILTSVSSRQQLMTVTLSTARLSLVAEIQRLGAHSDPD